MSTPPAIRTGRLLLRAPEPADAAPLVEALRESYDRLWPWLAWAAAVPTQEEAAARLEAARRRFLRGEYYWFVLVDPDDGRLLGGSSLRRRPAALEVGYWIRSRAEGQGYVSEAVGGMLRFGRRLGARRFEIRTVRENRRSVRVAERAGFRLETVLPRRHRHGDGTLLDLLVFGL